MGAATVTLAELRTARDWARAEYLTAAREVPRRSSPAERGRRWRAFLEANAAYELRAKGDAR